MGDTDLLFIIYPHSHGEPLSVSLSVSVLPTHFEGALSNPCAKKEKTKKQKRNKNKKKTENGL